MDIKKYIYGHCVSPVKTKVWDIYTQSYIYRELPCGKCLHCKNTHINEWCTRLFAEYKYRKFCYYVSLDYAPFTVSDATVRELARDTAAYFHDINKNKHFALHPLVLCKSHLQKFYKRLRFNTGVKCSYFACGEYGDEFSRPHFHNIIFSDSPLSAKDFDDAWTINGYKIGRVDFKDMHDPFMTEKDQLKIFKYVAKYLQKGNCDFEKLATIAFHRSYYKSLNETIRHEDLFKITLSFNAQKVLSWKDYTSEFSPFVVCSRRPAIGSAYFTENVERFKTQDFRLFGLSKEVCAIPNYYIRRTKESLCELRAVGQVSEMPSSSSRLGYISQVLRFLHDSSTCLENWSTEPWYHWCICRTKEGKPCIYLEDAPSTHYIPFASLHFYNAKSKIFYQFNGYGYTLWQKTALSRYGYMRVGTLDILCAADLIDKHFNPYYEKFIVPLHNSQVLRDNELNDFIDRNFKDKKEFQKMVDKYYQIELDNLYKKSKLVKNSRQNL